jgi:hypothetical protein
LPFFMTLEYFNELCIVIACYHYFMFTDFVPNPDTRYMVGQWLIYWTIFNLACNAAIIFFFTIKQFMNTCKKIKQAYRVKKHRAFRKIDRVIDKF